MEAGRPGGTALGFVTTLLDIQRFLDNPLPAETGSARLLAGSLGESPSKYSRSPSMWNAAFAAVGLDALYVPFDVRAERLAGLVAGLRSYPGFIGGNVTVPHKLAIMELLDEVDPLARQIGAVNTFAHTADDRLVGYNTDADGLIGSMLRPLPGQAAPFLDSLSGKRTLLIGAGGAARAAAFALAARTDGAPLTITNRTLQRAQTLAADAGASYPGVTAVSQEDALAVLPHVDLVVNASTVGQSGVRHLADGQATCLEPFSSLVPANPPVLEDAGDEGAFLKRWRERSVEAVEANNRAADRALRTADPATAFVDAVYSPEETVFLRQARLRGHRTLNGKGMLIMQAAASFVQRMTRAHLEAAGHDPDALHDRIVAAMAAAF